MKVDVNLNIRPLTRVEGHGAINVRIVKGKLIEASWDIIETPRFIEAMLKGQYFTRAGLLASRICGICSISHCLCSIMATENAMGVKISPTARDMRNLAKHGETLQSHILHLIFLAAPDFVQETSVLPLLEKRPEVVALGARLKGLGNKICQVIAGRTTHPVSFKVGGLAKAPEMEEIIQLQSELVAARKDLNTLAELFASFEIPDFIRETEYISLNGLGKYPFTGDEIISSDGVKKSANDYQAMTNEFVIENNTSKWTKLSRDSYAVGPLARFNNNHANLHDQAQKIAAALGLKPGCHNPFMNNCARLVECFHVVEEMILLIEQIKLDGLNENDLSLPVSPKSGEGVGVVEAPRGILFHHYSYDDKGRILKANCVVPTTQNNANIHYDLQTLVKEKALNGMIDTEIEQICSMLVRSYDPCISCSVH